MKTDPLKSVLRKGRRWEVGEGDGGGGVGVNHMCYKTGPITHSHQEPNGQIFSATDGGNKTGRQRATSLIDLG